MSKRSARQMLFPAVIAVVLIVIYANSFRGVFLLDDQASIENNLNISPLWLSGQALRNLFSSSRPVVELSLVLTYRLFGLEVAPYHAMNLLVHIGAALALFGIVRRTLLSERLKERFAGAAAHLALAVSLAWAAHPLQTQAVTYVIQRAESMMGLFFLLALYCVVRGAASRRGRVWYAAAFVLSLLSIGSKQVGAVLPLVLLIYDRIFLSASFRDLFHRRGWLYGMLAGTWLALGALLLSSSTGGAEAGFGNTVVTPLDYALTQPRVIVFDYLRLAFWPRSLCLDYFTWPLDLARGPFEIGVPLLVILGLMAATAWALARRPALGFLGVWFFVILAPSSSFIPLRDLAFEHRMYLPLAAVAAFVLCGGYALLTDLLGRLRTARPGLAVIVRRSALVLTVAMVGAEGLLTHSRNELYADARAMYLDVIAKRPANPRAWSNVGTYVFRSETPPSEKTILEAAACYRKAAAIQPEFDSPHYNLACMLSVLAERAEQRGDATQALQYWRDASGEFRLAVSCNAELIEARDGLGKVLLRLGELDEGLRVLESAWQGKPPVDIFPRAVESLLRRAQDQTAVQVLRRGLSYYPERPESLVKLGAALSERAAEPTARE